MAVFSYTLADFSRLCTADVRQGTLLRSSRWGLPSTESEPEPLVQEDPLSQFSTTVDVSRVVDGDTIEVPLTIDDIEDVRFIGVDTPEAYGGIALWKRGFGVYQERPYGPPTITTR